MREIARNSRGGYEINEGWSQYKRLKEREGKRKESQGPPTGWGGPLSIHIRIDRSELNEAEAIIFC